MKLNRRERLLKIATPLVVLSLVGVAVPAYAHDDIVGTKPAADSVVQAGVIDLELEYSAELLTIPESAEIIVLSPAEELMNNGCAVIEGRKLSTRVDLDQPGLHTVSWRVVSNDGHPIEGAFSFQVENSSGYKRLGIVPGTECDWAISALDSEPEADQSIKEGWAYWVLWLVLPTVGVGLFFWLRPRRKTNP